ncbi:PP2C family serine/threonine-protein phosphatase [Tropicimonas sp. IMCC6043]|uniref:PP2C family protein-serine/threonine phosphatase n=1 Tax=Tropicimonas sp. IMCC6043 TaxID=2510645 RepID=UPI0013EA2D9D|nr:protein phosphatase 2C domain-containing protein [Tropicimonas sp. IMCC6043]
MAQPAELCLDAATGLSLGGREEQEDAVLSDVLQDGGAGIVVLADGLGGHVAGAVASRIAVSTALSELVGQRDARGRLGPHIPDRLIAAAVSANHAILAHANSHPETAGMGATLLIAVVQDARLWWLSIGDSPFYLLRARRPRLLNEIHSLARQFDFLASVGEMDPKIAACHPDRSCLTSALGCTLLRQVDCPDCGIDLIPGDVLLAASDGILTLPEASIGDAVAATPRSTASDLVERLLRRVEAAEAAEQDNLSVAVLRVVPAVAGAGYPRPEWLRRLGFVSGRGPARLGQALRRLRQSGCAAPERAVPPK